MLWEMFTVLPEWEWCFPTPSPYPCVLSSGCSTEQVEDIGVVCRCICVYLPLSPGKSYRAQKESRWHQKMQSRAEWGRAAAPTGHLGRGHRNQ